MAQHQFYIDLWGLCFFIMIGLNFGQKHVPNMDINLMGKPGEGYYIGVHIGTPPQKFNVLVDTGSTNFAIAAAPNQNIDYFYKVANSSTYKARHRQVSVLYTQGHWSGELGNDILNFPSLKVHQVRCDIALIQTSHNFYMNGSQWQGILGLAYPTIIRPDRSVNSWLDSLQKSYNNNSSSSNPIFSLELCGSKPLMNHHTGRLRVEEEVVVTEKLITTPILKEWFYEVLLTGIVVGNQSVNVPCQEFNTDKTIVDSGTTNLRFPVKVFTAVVELLSASVAKHGKTFSNDFWTQQKMLCYNEELDWKQLPNVSLQLFNADKSYFTIQVTAESYIRMTYDNSEMNPRQFCYKFAIESSDTGSVLGVVVLEGFHVIFNQTGKTVGFEESHCGPPVSIFGPFATDKDLRSCANPKEISNLGALSIVAYIIASLLCICATVLVICLIKWFWKVLWHSKLPQSSSQTSLMSEE